MHYTRIHLILFFIQKMVQMKQCFAMILHSKCTISSGSVSAMKLQQRLLYTQRKHYRCHVKFVRIDVEKKVSGAWINSCFS
mmetsp:Transcript_69519/g.103515  ORF Transcript_69519/g.103515 Transcript_69519/m.103515 type:complete len:81 (+) Transcript_69519:642-884(+)